MSIFDAVLLGIVEGITEFLPVSSTGHLILTGDLLGLPSTELLQSFDIAIQSGAIAAAAWLYGRSLMQGRRRLLLVIAGFVPTGIAGLALHTIISTHLFGTSTVAIALFVGGVALIAFEWWMKKKKTSMAYREVESMTVLQAFMIGCAQAIALVPGTSRSAMTIMAGMLLGIERKAIVEYSFLLAIPTIAAATGYDLLKNAHTFSMNDAGVIAVGFVFSFFTAIVSIRFLLRFIRTHSFVGFGVYRIILAMMIWNILN